MPVAEITGKGNGVAFLVSAGIVYEIIAACCSSPQTTEINAQVRADTMMKWVNIGLLQSAGFVGIAMYVDKDHRVAIAAGGILAAGVMYTSYAHAKQAGLANPGPATEQWAGYGNQMAASQNFENAATGGAVAALVSSAV
jgi:hypothetical protein